MCLFYLDFTSSHIVSHKQSMKPALLSTIEKDKQRQENRCLRFVSRILMSDGKQHYSVSLYVVWKLRVSRQAQENILRSSPKTSHSIRYYTNKRACASVCGYCVVQSTQFTWMLKADLIYYKNVQFNIIQNWYYNI